MKCFFCDVQKFENGGNIIISSDNFISRLSGFPVSNGHCEIFPKKHIGSFFELDEKEVSEVFILMKETKKFIDLKFNPDSYNIGINEGKEAGQSVPHLHVHLIPRYTGDVKNPRGGVRYVLPDKANYPVDEPEQVFNIKEL